MPARAALLAWLLVLLPAEFEGLPASCSSAAPLNAGVSLLQAGSHRKLLGPEESESAPVALSAPIAPPTEVAGSKPHAAAAMFELEAVGTGTEASTQLRPVQVLAAPATAVLLSLERSLLPAAGAPEVSAQQDPWLELLGLNSTRAGARTETKGAAEVSLVLILVIVAVCLCMLFRNNWNVQATVDDSRVLAGKAAGGARQATNVTAASVERMTRPKSKGMSEEGAPGSTAAAPGKGGAGKCGAAPAAASPRTAVPWPQDEEAMDPVPVYVRSSARLSKSLPAAHLEKECC